MHSPLDVLTLDAVFFDLYGTLVIDTNMADANEQWTQLLGAFLRERGAVDIDDAALFRAFWAKPMPQKRGAVTPFVLRLTEFAEEVGGVVDELEAEPLADALCRVWQGFLPIADDAFNVLRRVGESHRVAVVSNFGHPPHVRHFLHEAGIGEVLEEIVVSGDYPFEKPDPRLLLEACTSIGVEPENTAYVGDSIVDYRAATNADMTPIRIKRNENRRRWPDDGLPNRFEATDRELEDRVTGGELHQIASLSQLLPLADEAGM